MGRKGLAACIAALLTIQAALLTYSAKVHSPTWDEVGHLAAGLSHWELGRFELYSVNPPLVRTIAAAPVHFFCDPQMEWNHYRSDPAVRSEVFLGRQMIQKHGEDAFRYFFYARLAVIPIALLGGWLCFLWARDLFGQTAGLLALAVWTFSPTVLAYGSVITPDLGSAVALMGASYALWNWMKQPTWASALVLCFALGLAILTKSVWLVLLPIFAAFWLVASLLQREGGREVEPNQKASARLAVWLRSNQGRQALQIGSASLLAMVIVNGFYGFTGSMRLLGDYTFVSSTFSGNPPVKSTTQPDCPECDQAERFSIEQGNRFETGVLSILPVPLPENFLQGIDVQLRDFERGTYDPNWQSYLNGNWQQGGWWYYYIVGLLVKVPLATWCLIGAGSIAALFWRPEKQIMVGVLCLWVPAILFFVIVSASTGLNRYVRYAIPVLPVLIVWGAQVGRLIERDPSGKPVTQRLGLALSLGVCVWLAGVAFWNVPHHLSYFNEMAGGSEAGQTVLCDSNIDWGQDLTLLQDWLVDNPEASESLHLAYFGAFDPKSIGIDYRPPPVAGVRRSRNLAVEAFMSGNENASLRPGWYVISKNYVAGHRMPLPNGFNHLQFQFVQPDAFARFRDMKPVDKIGHSMLVYQVPEVSPDTSSMVASSR